MNPLAIGLLSVATLIVLILCGIRIAFAMGIVSLAGFFLISGNPVQAASLVGSTFSQELRSTDLRSFLFSSWWVVFSASPT